MFNAPMWETYYLIQRALAEVLRERGSITFSGYQSRKINYIIINRFIKYLEDEGIDTTEIKVAMENPGRYLDAKGAEALGLPEGTKTARAVQKYLKRKGFVPDNKMFCYFADAVSPLKIGNTYEVKLEESPYDGYDRFVFTINGNDYCSADLFKERVVDTFEW